MDVAKLAGVSQSSVSRVYFRRGICFR
nr:LacI family DNA-binding transcriptional regulator [Sporosarcina ureae]